MAFKIINKASPMYLREEFQLFEATTTIDLRVGVGRDKLMFDLTNLESCKITIKTKLITEWNGLPLSLRSEGTLTLFKTKLKTWYFKQAFEDYL